MIKNKCDCYNKNCTRNFPIKTKNFLDSLLIKKSRVTVTTPKKNPHKLSN